MNARVRFNVSFDIVTPESAESGDSAERGFVVEAATLREAIGLLRQTRTPACDGAQSIEPDSMPCPYAVTVCNGMEFRTGAQESRTLHIPRFVTAASARRIARVAAHYFKR